MKKLMILDGNSIANRAFYGVRMLNAPDGTPTNAVFGFLNIFNRLMADIEPDAVAVAFDLKEKTFRHNRFEYYKAQRKPMPEDLSVQMPLIREVLDKMNIRYYTCQGYEADDILGTAGAICEREGWQCVIVTGDRDSLQLVTEAVHVCLIKSKGGQTETVLYTPEVFREEYGFEPKGIVDLKALMGDSSDNIPGVPGVGEKTANELIKKYKTLNAVYNAVNSEEIKESIRKKLIAGEQSARDSYWLATIVKDIPCVFKPEDNLWNCDFKPELKNLLLDPYFKETIEKLVPAWRKVAATALEYGVPAPAMTSALSYFDGYTTERLPANLLQAQRDYFGAHTYERLDSPRGQFFHTNWTGHGGNTAASTYNA